MQIVKIADVFPKNTFEKCTLCEDSKLVWLYVVIELISSDWKVIATCADMYIADIFFGYKRVINELTRTRHNCK